MGTIRRTSAMTSYLLGATDGWGPLYQGNLLLQYINLTQSNASIIFSSGKAGGSLVWVRRRVLLASYTMSTTAEAVGIVINFP